MSVPPEAGAPPASERHPLRRAKAYAEDTRAKVQSHPNARKTGLFFYYAAVVFLTITAIWLIIQTYFNHTLSQGCSDETTHILPDYKLLALAFVALIFGRLLGYLRYKERWQNETVTGSRILGTTAFSLFAIAGTIALVYESIGVFHDNTLHVPTLKPITSYVRCAIVIEEAGGSRGVVSYLVIFVICTLVGLWLWAWHAPGEFDLDKT